MTNYYASDKDLKQINDKNTTLSNSNVYSDPTNANLTLNNSSQNYTFQNSSIPYVSENVPNSYTVYNPNPVANSTNYTTSDSQNKESNYYYYNPNRDGNAIANSLNGNLSYNENLYKSGNNYVSSNEQNYNDIPSTNKRLYLSSSDFLNKNAYSDAINTNKSLENPISSQTAFEQGSSRTYEFPKETLNNNRISGLNLVSSGNSSYPTQIKSSENYKSEIDQMIKNTFERAGLPYQPTTKTSSAEPTTTTKYYSSSGPRYESNTANQTVIPQPAYQSFAKSYQAGPKVNFEDPVKIENKTVILPSYQSTDKREFSLNDSGYPNYVNAVASNDMSTNNNLYNEQITFKDNLSNNGSVNLFNSNITKENNFNTNPNYTFENLKSEENFEKRDLGYSVAAARSTPLKAEEILEENLNKSSNEQFKASTAILEQSDKATKKVEGVSNANYNPIAISNLKKNEDMFLVSNKNTNPRTHDSTRQSAKEKVQVNTEKKEEYVNTQTSANFQKEYLSEEDLKNLLFELGQNYNKELCGEQINIISRYLEIGKVLSSMLAGILNNVNPVNRMEAFKILISNVHDWPNDESYFNGVICFLPTANQKEATEIVKRMNRSNCCCTIF